MHLLTRDEAFVSIQQQLEMGVVALQSSSAVPDEERLLLLSEPGHGLSPRPREP